MDKMKALEWHEYHNESLIVLCSLQKVHEKATLVYNDKISYNICWEDYLVRINIRPTRSMSFQRNPKVLKTTASLRESIEAAWC